MMIRIRIFINSLSIIVLSLVIAFSAPGVEALAQSSNNDINGESCINAGSVGPNGADSGTFKHNCTTGLWENAHYTYNPVSYERIPKDKVVYTYNSLTGQWDFSTWEYHAPSGNYILLTQSVAQPPSGAQTIGSPSVSPSGSQGSNTNSSSKDNSVSIHNTNGNNINNTINSNSQSGNANVIANTNAGDATSGNTQAVLNLMTLLQTNSSLSGENGFISFIKNIDGDVNGDLMLDPNSMVSYYPDEDVSSTVNEILKTDTNNQITNDVDLNSTSGDANVVQNTIAGNAKTGSATAVANIMNIINSAVSSGKSFVGVININGNLNGDILLPDNFIDQLIASNVPSMTLDTAMLLEQQTNTGITNNINTSANSGEATVSANTEAGSAITGNSNSKITTFNLTGSQVIGRNSMLVFVNVLGEWVGLIVNAPQGATAAQLGGGITNTSQNSDINSKTSSNITNNINVAAKSGDANVSQNTTAGDAVSGAADVAVNLLNIANSTMSFADWFGILFINVFGSWNGSFGINTSAGDPQTSSPSENNQTNTVPLFISFIPSSVRQTVKTVASIKSSNSSDNNQSDTPETIGNTNTQEDKSTPVSGVTSNDSSGSTRTKYGSGNIIPLLASSAVGMTLLAGENIVRKRRSARRLNSPPIEFIKPLKSLTLVKN